jgi:hypothetical protein
MLLVLGAVQEEEEGVVQEEDGLVADQEGVEEEQEEVVAGQHEEEGVEEEEDRKGTLVVDISRTVMIDLGHGLDFLQYVA